MTYELTAYGTLAHNIWVNGKPNQVMYLVGHSATMTTREIMFFFIKTCLSFVAYTFVDPSLFFISLLVQYCYAYALGHFSCFDGITRSWIAVYKSIPEEWQTGLIVPVWKRKGYIHDPGKYRDITLLSHILKVFVTDVGVCVCKVAQTRGGSYLI